MKTQPRINTLHTLEAELDMLRRKTKKTEAAILQQGVYLKQNWGTLFLNSIKNKCSTGKSVLTPLVTAINMISLLNRLRRKFRRL